MIMSKSQIFLYFCLSFILGVFIQSLLDIPLPLWLGILSLGIILAAICWSRNKKLVVVGFCLIILALGAARASQVAGTENTAEQYNDKEKIILIGRVADEPDERSDNIRYKIAAAEINGQKITGDILLIAKKYPAYHYGDQLEAIGKLLTPKNFEDFDYRQYLAKDEIYSVVYYPEIKLLNSGQGNKIKAALFWVKNKFERSIKQILAEPKASFLAGLLLGEKRGLPANLMADFSRTGTTHIIALSGYNITIIAWSLMAFFNFLLVRRQISFWLAISVIVLFVLMVGASASAARAAVMGVLMLLALQVGRLYSIRNALVFAGALMIYFNPKILVWDVGFQLSFAATLGLIYLAPILESHLGKKNEKDELQPSPLGWREILVATLAAQIAVLPLLLINFGQLSLIAPLANLLILFFIPLTMLFGFIAGFAGMFWLALGKILAWPAWLFLTYEIKITELLSAIPLAAIAVKWNWWLGGGYYLLLVYLVWRFNIKSKKSILASKVENT
ncbi:MAG: ComEC/Rec2-related protein [Parcubacteria group bacterium GW2011_GWC2_42_6]|nr:MAG: ComEC/Rec2-related protein [Parcubacteria group bacterium GW2011_GWA2_42_11]KKS67332.1 MAG: ComEC/Rec2-related protein [Parcubacteria group bacterium GW2011_GWC2_42_6]KKT76483.1 MAG: ComEC/Rec2-related protein [Parcubacteria group bacterium GW2011_GWF2_44_7]